MLPELTLHLCFDTGLSDTRGTGTVLVNRLSGVERTEIERGKGGREGSGNGVSSLCSTNRGRRELRGDGGERVGRNPLLRSVMRSWTCNFSRTYRFKTDA